MDQIKKPYRVDMRFWKDDLASTVPVQWYFVDDTARYWPWATPFRSRAYDIHNHDGGLVLGEDITTIRYGPPDSVPHGPGLTVCGAREVWENGANASTRIPPINALTGLPCCCGPAPRLGVATTLSRPDNNPDTNYLLQENLSRILQEDESGILWR